MSGAAADAGEYHLLLEADEVRAAAGAVRLFESDEAHESEIRAICRQLLELLAAPGDDRGRVTLALSPAQMKIAHSAVRLLINDLQRGQADEREVLWRIVGKLPDEHVMRAIEI